MNYITTKRQILAYPYYRELYGLEYHIEHGEGGKRRSLTLAGVDHHAPDSFYAPGCEPVRQMARRTTS